MKKQRGITLIALIITILVILILTAITLAIALGENGIISNAKRAKQEHENAVFIEDVQMISLGYYDAVKGEYNFIEMQEAIKEKYPSATFFYSIKNENDVESAVGLGGDNTTQVLLQSYAQYGKNHMISCVVTKDESSITISNTGIKKGDLLNNGKVITHEEAEKLYNISGIENIDEENVFDAVLVSYKANESNIIIPEVVSYGENKWNYSFETISDEAFMSIDSANVQRVHGRDFLAETFKTTLYNKTGIEKDKNDITLGDIADCLNITDFDNTTRAIKVLTTNEDEKEIICNIGEQLFLLPNNLTKNDCDIENNEFYFYFYNSEVIVSKNMINRKMTNVVIPYGIRIIKSEAFAGNKNLKEVTIGMDSTITASIASDVFLGCDALETIKFPNLTKEQVMTNFPYYTNAWGANTNVKINCSDGTIEL